MKKIFILFTVVVIVLACSKKETLPTSPTIHLPTKFNKDSSVFDRDIQLPKNTEPVFEGMFNTGSINGFSLTNIKVKLIKGGDSSLPEDYMKRVYAVVEGSVSGTYTSEVRDSVYNEFTFNNFVKNFAQYQIGRIKIYSDILTSATNNNGLVDYLIVEVQLTYTAYSGNGSSLEYFQTSSVFGHKTIFH